MSLRAVPYRRRQAPPLRAVARLCCSILIAWHVTAPLNEGYAQAESSQTETSLAYALTSGSPILGMRLRYEQVDQENISQTGNAVTLRTLAGWQTSSWRGWSGKAELINVGRADNDYNDGLNGKTQYPVIPDPDDSDINQLYVDFEGLPETRLRGGRQRIQLDNGRFVANNGFRQVMQVFNGVSMENNSIANTRLYAAYLARVKTSLARQHETSTVLLNARYALSQDHVLTGYGYLQDQPNAIPAAAFQGPPPSDTSNQITGLRAAGKQAIGDQWQIVYTAEYARQTDYAGGDARIDADFVHLGGGARIANLLLRADYQALGSNGGGYAFQMPLGTRHPFQGWADRFVITPTQGIRDHYVSGVANIDRVKILAAFHTFRSDVGGVDFGEEFDVGIAYAFFDKFESKLEYADYRAGDAGSGQVDVTKLWLTLTFNY